MLMSALSLEYVLIPVTDRLAGTDPTSDTVQMAFLAQGAAPASGDWKTASWYTDSTGTIPVYYARCLVGPGGTTSPSTGTYVVWLKFTDNPEVPVLRATGQLVVY